MKKTIVLSLLFTFALLHAQESRPETSASEKSDHSAAKIPMSSPREMIHQDFSISHIKIDYSRPSIGTSKRKIFGALVPFDQVWRTGANKATMITFGQDVKIGGNLLYKGEYALYTIPKSSGKWTVIFSEDKELFMKDTKNGIPQEAIKLQTEADVMYQDKAIETFTIGLVDLKEDQATVWLAWENMGVSFTVEVADKNVVMKAIDELVQKGDKKNHFEAARYYSVFYAEKTEIMAEDRAKVEKALGWLRDMAEDSKHLGWHMIKTKLLIILKDKTAAEHALAETEKKAKDRETTTFATQLDLLKKEIAALPAGKTNKKTPSKKK